MTDFKLNIITKFIVSMMKNLLLSQINYLLC